MKRVFSFIVIFFLPLLIFFLIVPSLYKTSAATCAESGYTCAAYAYGGGATCSTGFYPVRDTTCTSSSYCCAPACKSPNYCNLTCEGYGSTLDYCSGGNTCCKTAATTPCNGTCINSSDTCTTPGSGYCNTIGTKCCKSTSPTQTCTAAGGTCMPICSAPISGTTGCTSPSVCCGSGAKTCAQLLSGGSCVDPLQASGCTQTAAGASDCTGGKVCCVGTVVNPTGTSTIIIPVKDCNIAGCDNPVEDYDIQSVCSGNTCQTGIGPIDTTNFQGFARSIFAALLSISGVIAAILIIISGYKLVMSRGNPQKVQEAREQLSSAIVGLLFIIFSLVFVEFIGLDVLGLPGFVN